MRMKSVFMGTLEIVGEIDSLKVQDGWLIMNMTTTTPTGWNLNAALSHKDLVTLLKLMFKPSNLRYVIFGFGKPKDEKQTPNY